MVVTSSTAGSARIVAATSRVRVASCVGEIFALALICTRIRPVSSCGISPPPAVMPTATARPTVSASRIGGCQRITRRWRMAQSSERR